MDFDWDSAKNNENVKRRGFAEGVPLTVVFTDRTRSDGTTVRRIISARVSNRKERKRYGKTIEGL